MMKTKKYILTALAAMTLGAVSCNDSDFLTEKPKTIYTIENSFNTTDQVEAAVTNLYLHIRYWFTINNFMKGLGTDILDTPQWRSSGNGYSNFSTWSTSYGPTKDVYNAYYQLVAYANMAIYGAELETLTWDSDDAKNSAIGQSRFFRGFAYLTLGELFGGVPLVDQVYQTVKLDFVRSTREETYKFAIADLEAAVDALPEHPEEAGRVAKGAAYHYLAEAYLALATELNNDETYLQKSVDAASAAMSLHSLMTERFGTRAAPTGGTAMNGVNAYYANGDVFFDLFQRGNLDYSEGNTEALWTLENDYTVYHEHGGDNYLAYPRNFGPVMRNVYWKDSYKENGANACPWDGNIDASAYPGSNVCAYLGGRTVSSVAPTEYVVDGVWNGQFADDMRNSNSNIRRSFICLDRNHSMYGKVVTKDMLAESNLDRYYPIWTKFSPIDDWGYEDLADGGNRSNMYRDDYACRLGETYLLRAEAYLRMGNKTKAAADINVLRNRAHCSHLATEAEVDLNFILDERVRELFLEERRWCTLLRMGGTVAADHIKAHSYYMADHVSYTGNIDWNLFPIPQSVIDANLNAVLEQNPGWD
ncbi:RagB/SusD family nutrient uptake outer membrane protein [uncultured Bacteroides sp.]|uniref:RagB/SusD family nutrient uptake outer membrane protein n=1 Tax=uncultured Bacteroides sp. TaxID=162156 RepID=UPI002AAA9BD0|nr:RagB/SusD family nutrient uptake outer membrane protein [uncultured Bacteroides sp.]